MAARAMPLSSSAAPATAYPARSEQTGVDKGAGGSMRMRIRDSRNGGPDRARAPKARQRVSQHESHPRAGSGQSGAGLSPASPLTPWGVEGPVQAEVFVLRMRAGRPELAGPCGPDPWYIEVAAEDDPVEVVSRLSRNLMGEPVLVHSTSWRRARGAVVLSFVVVNSDAQAPQLVGVPISRAQLARSSATSAAKTIAAAQVLEHGLRHLAWLSREDQVVMATLSDEWKHALEDYVPEPFRNLV